MINSRLFGDEENGVHECGLHQSTDGWRCCPPQADRDARIAAVVREHYAFVWRVLRRFGLLPTDADDAAQQVFLIAAGRIDDIDLGKERAFLSRTAMRVASKAHRARRRRPEDADPECGERADLEPGAEELVDRHRARALLDAILDEMSDDLKAVIVLFEIEGLTMSEIAEALLVPPGTVASRLRRARAELEARVTRHGAPGRHGGAAL
jgi:RNA polymerase sigma-70 factor (ECF subfamily)